MDIAGGVGKVLHTGVAVFKGPHAQANHRAAGKELQAVLEEDGALNGVFVGEQALKAVGHKAGQQLVAQLQGIGPVGADEGGGGEGGVLLRLEGEVDHGAVLGDGEAGILHRALIEGRGGVHHGLLAVLALHGDGEGGGAVQGQGVVAAGGIGGAAQGLPRRQAGAAGDVQGQGQIQGGGGQQGQQQGQGHAAPGGQEVGGPAARQLVQQTQGHSGQDGGAQGHGLDAGPVVEGGEIDGEGGGQGHHQGLYHADQQSAPALLPLQKQIDQEGRSQKGRRAHAEGQDKAQGVQSQAGQVDVAVPARRGGGGQAQGDEDADAGAAGVDVGVANHRGHADPGLYAGHGAVGRLDEGHEAQEGGAQGAGGDEVNAEQTGEGGA